MIAECHPEHQMIVVVDGIPQKINLTSELQSSAYIEADPCLKHDIKLKVFSDSDKTGVTKYNDKLDESLYSGHLYATIHETICLNKDNITVEVHEPSEPLRSCIITRGNQTFERTEFTESLIITGLINLTIVNPQKDSDSNQPDEINITVSVTGIKRCNTSADKVDQTGSDSDEKGKVVSAAIIVIPLALFTLVIVGLIAGFVFHQIKRKQREREIAVELDENPVYGHEVYEHDNYGNMRQDTIEVTDSNPIYGETAEEWEGAYVTDTNEDYA